MEDQNKANSQPSREYLDRYVVLPRWNSLPPRWGVFEDRPLFETCNKTPRCDLFLQWRSWRDPECADLSAEPPAQPNHVCVESMRQSTEAFAREFMTVHGRHTPTSVALMKMWPLPVTDWAIRYSVAPREAHDYDHRDAPSSPLPYHMPVLASYAAFVIKRNLDSGGFVLFFGSVTSEEVLHRKFPASGANSEPELYWQFFSPLTLQCNILDPRSSGEEGARIESELRDWYKDLFEGKRLDEFQARPDMRSVWQGKTELETAIREAADKWHSATGKRQRRPTQKQIASRLGVATPTLKRYLGKWGLTGRRWVELVDRDGAVGDTN